MKKRIGLLLSLLILSYTSLAHAEKTVLAGGCFWCVESDFEKLQGVTDAVSGFTGGTAENPTYSGDHAGHYEAVEITYDPKKINYQALLDYYWVHIDPFDPRGQFCDKGHTYQSAIFVANEQEREIAEHSKKAVEHRFPNKTVATKILDASTFYPIKGNESYHQDFYKKSPVRYKAYRWNCGRDQRVHEIWGDTPLNTDKADTHAAAETKKYVIPSKSVLKKQLTPIQYHVTQEAGTERSFDNEYWDNKAAGIYVDIVSGEPLFSSLDKYKSNTGWPSFTKPLESANIVERNDISWFGARTEIVSKHANSHLGHVFSDGPAPTGLRYCMNSASLKFVPVAELEAQGYGEYSKLFANTSH